VRIVSLLPSATEIVALLGLEDDLVGVTFECDTPPGVREGRAILVHGLATVGRSAGEIDALVRETVAADLPMYTLDEVAFAACDPDLVLTQDLCRVCALPSGDVDAALSHLGCTAAVVSLDPHHLDEVIDSVLTVARAAGVPERGERLAASLRHRLAAVERSVAGRARQRTFVLEWTDPAFLAGHWIPEMVVAAGGDPVLARPGGRSVEATWHDIDRHDPDVIVVAPCGFGLDDAIAQADSVLDRLPERAAVWAIDANGYTVRPGPRLVDGVEQLAAVLHGVAPVRDDIVRHIR
jgi:iron complex transport system substrate-binding protein